MILSNLVSRSFTVLIFISAFYSLGHFCKSSRLCYKNKSNFSQCKDNQWSFRLRTNISWSPCLSCLSLLLACCTERKFFICWPTSASFPIACGDVPFQYLLMELMIWCLDSLRYLASICMLWVAFPQFPYDWLKHKGNQDIWWGRVMVSSQWSHFTTSWSQAVEPKSYFLHFTEQMISVQDWIDMLHLNTALSRTWQLLRS